jgi:hypothetical protein
MKHPKVHTLQEYFENHTDTQMSEKIKTHLSECDRCSLIVSEMAKIDIIFAKTQSESLALNKKEILLRKAKTLLAQKRSNIELQAKKEDQLRIKKEKILGRVSDYKVSLFGEMKRPILQTAVLLIVCAAFTEFSRTSLVTINKKTISGDVRIFYSEQSKEQSK